MNSSLEEKSWYIQQNFLPSELCQSLIKYSMNLNFVEGKIGRGIHRSENELIRNNSINWIDSWEVDPSLHHVNSLLNEIMQSTSRYFRLSLKRFESQLATYQKGGFYKIHLDQHPKTRHRQLSCNLYLNDCVSGGEIVLYEKGSKVEIAKTVKPQMGTLVLFFSKDIYHEVKLVQAPRHSITTWFRDDEIQPFV